MDEFKKKLALDELAKEQKRISDGRQINPMFRLVSVEDNQTEGSEND